MEVPRTNDAQERFDLWCAELEKTLRSDTEHPAFEAHLSKYRKLIPALALLIHLATQARQSGLSDAEIAMLIGEKTGPAIVALTYGDVRPDHLLKQAQRIRLTVKAGLDGQEGASSIKRSITLPDVSAGLGVVPSAANVEGMPVLQGL